MKLIVGLGNPGKEYEKTRHNVGFMIVDALASSWKLEKKLQAEISEATIDAERVLLAKPQTFMNLSGEAVQKIASFYKIDPADVVIIYDDVDLEFGKLRVRHGGSSGGHNGVKSVLQHLGDEFIRFRVGVRNETVNNPIATDKFVLAPFSSAEQAQMGTIIEQATHELRLRLQNPEEYSRYLLQ